MTVKNDKPIILHHYIMPNQLSGPNVSVNRIVNSSLNKKYKFKILIQDRLAGGKINLGLILYLMKKIKKIKPDILHITGLQSAGFHCICAGKLAGCKHIVVTIRGFSGDDMTVTKLKRWAFNNVVEPLTLWMADAVYGVSEYVIKRAMVKKYARNLVGFIYNLPTEPYLNSNNEKSIREELKLTKKDILIVTACRVVIDKGFVVLAQAIKQLNDMKHVKFLVIGNGKYFQRFSEIVADDIADRRVYLLGGRNDVQRILAGCDIFVLPSFHETLSNVTIEAAVEGLSIVVSDTGGLSEIIDHNVDGLLVPPGDAGALSRSIRYLVEHPEMRSRFGVNAKKKIQNKFSKESITRKIDEVYQQLLKNKLRC